MHFAAKINEVLIFSQARRLKRLYAHYYVFDYSRMRRLDLVKNDWI